MPNVGMFIVSRTAEQAVNFLKGDHAAEPERFLTLEYSCALFWHPVFSPSDELRIQPHPRESWVDDDESFEFSVYLTTISAALERLRLRKKVVLSLLPRAASAIYGGYYDEWVSFWVGATDTLRSILWKLSLSDPAEGERTLRRAITILSESHASGAPRAWRTLGRTGAVMPFDLGFTAKEATDTATMWRHCLAGGDVSGWPPPPTRIEILLAALVRWVGWLIGPFMRSSKSLSPF